MLTPGQVLSLRILIAREQYIGNLFNPWSPVAEFWWASWNRAIAESAELVSKARRRRG